MTPNILCHVTKTCRNHIKPSTASTASAISLPITFSRGKTTAAAAATPAIAKIFNLDTKDHCIYTTSKPPTESELDYAHRLFTKQRPRHLWTEHAFAQIPLSDQPEVLLLGRSNVGKSSLINLLVSAQICQSSGNRQVTRTLNAFEVGFPGLKFTLIDSPGYGSRAKEDWGPLMEKFITRRKPLRKCFVIIDASVGPKSSDEDMLKFLQYCQVPHQIIASKADKLLIPGSTRSEEFISNMRLELREQLRSYHDTLIKPYSGLDTMDGDLISYCGWKHNRRFGLGLVRWAILRAAGLHEHAAEEEP